MNKDWAERNKRMQELLKKQTFGDGISELISLRGILFEAMLSWRQTLAAEEFSAMPFPNADGYHSKTAAYSLWHIFRIEDIVVNTLIRRKTEVLFAGGFDKSTHSPIITTGNELTGGQIADFSRALDIGALYDYCAAVRESTDTWLLTLDASALKIRFTGEDAQRIRALHVVSTDEKAAWLIEYWCGKDLKGLIQMPLSRHHIMHTEAAERIIGGIGRKKK